MVIVGSVGDRIVTGTGALTGREAAYRVAQARVSRYVSIAALALGGCITLGAAALYAYELFISTASVFAVADGSILLRWVWGGGILIAYGLYRRSEQRHALLTVSRPTGARAAEPTWDAIGALPARARISVLDACTEDAWDALHGAYELARRFGGTSVTPLHLFASLLMRSRGIRAILYRLGVDMRALVQSIGATLVSEGGGEAVASPELRSVLVRAYAHAAADGAPHIDARELLAAAVEKDERIAEACGRAGIHGRQLEDTVRWFMLDESVRRRTTRYGRAALLRSKSGLDRAMTAVATPRLNAVSEDITEAARRGVLVPCVGREAEFEQLFRLAQTASSASALVVGERGVGARAFIEGLAQRIVGGDVPGAYREHRLVRIDTAALIAGASASEAHERLLMILDEAARARNVILCVENIHEWYGISGASGALDLAELLAEAAAKKIVTVLATTHPGEYARLVERSSLGGALSKLELPEPSQDDARAVLMLKASALEGRHGITYTYQALEAAVALSARYIHEQYLPEKAIRLLEEAGVYTRAQRGASALVTDQDVAAVLSQRMHAPIAAATADESQKLLHLEDAIRARVIGQDDAVAAVAAALRRARAELRDVRRPIASFLFLGPTGVGKTELAKAVAASYFGGEEQMVRFDMSEFQEQHSLYRLIGAPAGAAGSEHGQLTEAVRKNPYTIVLLDELEKAHPDILNLFLQVLDDGHLSDSAGVQIDFTNTIIIATSNAGAAYIQDSINSGVVDLQRIRQNLVEHELRNYYRPEFLNRFDGIIVFRPLGIEEITRITRGLLEKVAARLEDKHIHFRITDAAVDELAQIGFDPQFGARPLRRAIQERVDTALADLLLRQQVDRSDTVVMESATVLRVEKAS